MTDYRAQIEHEHDLADDLADGGADDLADGVTGRVVIGGIDTHLDFHVAAAVTALGVLLATSTFPATATGYTRLLGWLRSLGTVHAVGIEGPGSYGAGLARHLAAAGIEIHEIDRPDRADRRRRGKSDAYDAESAARRVLAGLTRRAKLNTGAIEALRILKMQHDSAVKQRTATINQIHQLRVTAPEELRASLSGLTKKTLPAHCARYRIDTTRLAEPLQAAKRALRGLAKRALALEEEARDLEREITALVTPLAPRTLAVVGTGPLTVAQLLITIGENPDRFTNQAAFAALCGVSPIPASSGKSTRHRLNRGGDRRANSALHMTCLSRLAHHQPTKSYIAARTNDNKSDAHLRRKLKRYIARELFTLLRDDINNITTKTTNIAA
jgi:transposase